MDVASSTQQTTASSTFNKNEFLLSKLSEMATRSDQISNAMQIALGFIMTLTAALLAILVSIGQTINGNSAMRFMMRIASQIICSFFFHRRTSSFGRPVSFFRLLEVFQI